MSLSVSCPNCSMELEAPAELAGRPATCPGCKQQFIVTLEKGLHKETESPEAVQVPVSHELETSAETAAQRRSEFSETHHAKNLNSIENPAAASSRQLEHDGSESEHAMTHHDSQLKLDGQPATVARFKGLPAADDQSSDKSELDRSRARSVRNSIRSDSGATDTSSIDSGNSEDSPYRSAAIPDGNETRRESSTLQQLNVEQADETKQQPPASPHDESTRQAGNSESGRKRRRRRISSSTQRETIQRGASQRDTNQRDTNRRRVQSAKLVTDQQSESRIQLGADGTLPKLVVNSLQAETKEETSDKNDSPPWMLIGVLAISVILSVAMLFVPSELPHVQRTEREERLEHIRTHYFGSDPLRDYEVLLRKAVQYENRGERAEARAVYHQVLDLLRAEGVDDTRGVSGPRFAYSPPNDSDLEETLQALIRTRE